MDELFSYLLCNIEHIYGYEEIEEDGVKVRDVSEDFLRNLISVLVKRDKIREKFNVDSFNITEKIFLFLEKHVPLQPELLIYDALFNMKRNSLYSENEKWLLDYAKEQYYNCFGEMLRDVFDLNLADSPH